MVLQQAAKPALWGGFSFSGLLSCGAVAVLVLLVWFLFFPALPGIIQFDDLGNLSDLNRIDDGLAAWMWIREGRAGPLGRPISLATFALQHYEWPSPHAFLLWNIALHCINTVLVLWLAMLATERLEASLEKQLATGFLTALCWASMPLLNTSTLFIIQRMTLLSSTFMLAGLIAYLKQRGAVTAGWKQQLFALSWMAAFGLLAILAKENGALIVVYGLILEILILTTSPKHSRPNFSVITLSLACAILFAGLLPYLFWSAGTELQRGFTMQERLASQGFILLTYLKGLFFPIPRELNPFRYYSASYEYWQVIAGIGIWLVIMLSPLIVWRYGWKRTALTLAWFFYGHLLESGWISLEPYFAHRNYVPAAGFVFALTHAILSQKKNTKLWQIVFSIYILTMGGMTWMNTSLWGKSELAAEIWAKELPNNSRAAMNLAYELERTQNLSAALVHLDRFIVEGRDSVGIRMVTLTTACLLMPNANHSDRVEATKNAILTQPFEGWATETIKNLIEIVRKGNCPGVTEEQVGELAAAFMSRPAYQTHPAIASNLLSILGLVAQDQGDKKSAMDFYLKAIEHSAAYGMVNLYFHLAQQANDTQGLLRLRTAVMQAPQPHGVTKIEWKTLLKKIENTTENITQEKTHNPHSTLEKDHKVNNPLSN